MMTTVAVLILGIFLFITIVNYTFQKNKYKYLPMDEIKKLNVFNSPTAWLIYSAIIGIVIGILVCDSFIDMVNAFSSMGSSSSSTSDIPSMDTSN